MSNFTSFLVNSIDDQNSYIKEHPTEKNKIIDCAKKYLQESPQEPQKNELKLKAWLLLPKRLTSGLDFENISVDSTFEDEVVNSILKTKEYWRLNKLKQWGIHLRVPNDDYWVKPDTKWSIRFRVPSDDWMEPDKAAKTPIHHLCDDGMEELAIELFKKYCHDRHLSPLRSITLASERGLTAIAKCLIDELKDVNQIASRSKELSSEIDTGDSLLHAIIQSKDPNLDVIRHLVKKGANLEQKNAQNLTPLSLIMFPPYNISNGKVLKGLLKLGAKVDIESLQKAITSGIPINLIKVLIRYSQEEIPLEDSGKGQTNLFMTALRLIPSDFELIQFFLDQGVHLNKRDFKGNTPLHSVLIGAPSLPDVVSFLINHGADIHAKNDEGESCSWLMKVYQIESPFLKSANTEYDTEFYLRKLVANSWSIDKETEMDGNIFNLQSGRGLAGEAKVTEILNKLNVHAEKFIDLSNACKLIEEGFKKSKESPDYLEKKFHDSETLLFTIGWSQHAISVAFIGDYLLIINRGQGRKSSSVKAYKIDRTSSFEDIANNLQHNSFMWDYEKGSKFLYKDLPASLGYKPSKQDLICKVLERKCRQSNQKIGNCWFISPKSAVLGILAIKELIKAESIPYKSQKERQQAYETIVDSTQAFYKYYTTFLKLQILKEYLERPPDSIGRDHELIRDVVQKLYLKSSKYLFDQEGLVEKAYSFFVKMIGMKTKQIFPPPFKKEEIEKWIEEYRKKFNLPEEYLIDHLLYIGR